MTAAAVPITMGADGEVEVTVESPVQVTCYWADKELNSKFARGRFNSPSELQEAIKSHLIADREGAFTKRVQLPKGENYIYFSKSQNGGMDKFQVSYSIKKL